MQTGIQEYMDMGEMKNWELWRLEKGRNYESWRLDGERGLRSRERVVFGVVYWRRKILGGRELEIA